MSIKALPDDVVSQIRSSAVITSLNGVVDGLLRNALDAGATKIHISVDYRRGNCEVEDDGLGIRPAEFKSDGGLGKPHYTSKYPPSDAIHGKYGCFLASTAALSLVSVTSRHRDHISHNSICVHNSKVVSRNVPALPEQRLLSFLSGTRIVVRDLFGLMPVRVKQRAAEADGNATKRKWKDLIRLVVALLLAWPAEVRVMLRDSFSKEGITLNAPYSTFTQGRISAKLLATRTSNLLSQAALCSTGNSELWIPIVASADGITVHGSVSLEPAPTRRIQFISLGIDPLCEALNINVLLEEVNKMFSESSFGVLDDGDACHFSNPDSPSVRVLTKELKTKKGVDKWPMFAIKISKCQKPILATETTPRPNDLSTMLNLLRTMFGHFLVKHHFLPRTKEPQAIVAGRSPACLGRTKSATLASLPLERLHDRSSSAPLTSRGLRSQSPHFSGAFSSASKVVARDAPSQGIMDPRPRSAFAAWSQVKPSALSPSRLGHDFKTHESLNDCGAFASLPGASLSSEFESRPTAPGSLHGGLAGASLDGEAATPSNEQPETFVWENPRTKVRSLVDSRTGFVIQPRSTSTDQKGAPMAHHEAPSRRLTLKQPSQSEPRQPKAWVSELLTEWKNPVFEPVETAIPRLVEDLYARRGNYQRSHSHQAVQSLGRLFRNSLRQAVVINQVDSKFILAIVAAKDGSHTLVLVDQHAADERCQVEKLMQNYFEISAGNDGQLRAQAKVLLLDNPIQLEPSKEECFLFERHREFFAHWGVCYDVISAEANGVTRGERRGSQVRVYGLPPAISERCRLEPQMFADMLRKELWLLDSENGPQVPPNRMVNGSMTDHGWVVLFQGCPQGILDLINSRSCRSAIMFNDPLTVEDCRELLRRLADCAFPFQCAHGRPSMIKELDLGGGTSAMDAAVKEASHSGQTYVAAFKDWRGKHLL